MSTRSFILKENKDGTYTGIYCHNDGDLSFNGKILALNYDDRKKVEELISLGDLSSLGSVIHPDKTKPHTFTKPQRDVCVFYGRDRGETDVGPTLITLKKLDNDICIEFTYVYTLDNQWKYFESGELHEGLIPLKEKLRILGII